MSLKKLLILKKEYSGTTLVEGSSFKYFFAFWLTKFFSLLQQVNEFFNRAIHKVVLKLPKSQFVIKNRSGIFLVQAFDDSTTICSDYFEKDIRDWLSRPLEKDVLIDIGANRGIYSVIAPTRYWYKAIHAFEPNLEVFSVLEKNISLNKLTEKVTCHQVALGGGKDTMYFTVDPMHKGGGRVVDQGVEGQMKVEVEALDQILLNLNPSRVSFVKIDTEGFEHPVLYGMQKILNQMKRGSCIMIETTEILKVETILAPFGFKLIETNNYDHLFQKHA